MVLSRVLRGFATARPHLLLVEGTAGTAGRLAVERLSRERGWPLVATPADADLLVVVGAVDDLAEHVDRVWEQLPGPRAQVRLAGADADAALDRARAALQDVDAQRADVRRTERPPAGTPADMGDMDMGDMDMGGMDLSHADMSHADMGHMDGGMDMPAGLGMADRATDRDGLKLDVLTVPWGPVLQWWPAGLVVATVLQGDVVQQADVQRLGDDEARRDGWTAALAQLAPPTAAGVVRLDALVRLLGVAGWDGARLRCQRVRDRLLVGQPTPDLTRLVRQVSRSRSLARMTTGLPTTGDEDLTARYRRWLAEADEAISRGALPPPADEPDAARRLAELLEGSELAVMRLVVAGADLALSGADARTSRV